MKKTETGIYKQANGNYGFIETDSGDSVFVHGSKARGALDGDEVSFQRIPQWDGREEARVFRIEKRSDTPKFGKFKYSKRVPIVTLFSPADRTIVISDSRIPFPKPGTTVGIAVSGFWPMTYGTLVTEIGNESDELFEENLLIATSGVPTDFPAKVEREAKALRTPAIKPGRRDLRGRTIITIDGADAKDLDDAIEVMKTDKWYTLSVHIADVAEYVREWEPLDKEALKRSTSIYLADRVIPMLPKELSNGLCSLHPGSPKFCLSVDMDIDLTGQVTETTVYESVIESAHRATYEEVQEARDTGKSDTLPPEVMSMLKHAWDLKKILDIRRKSEWKIKFPSRETKIILKNGKVDAIVPRIHLDSHDLIEEFMVIANEEVAKWSLPKKLPFLYRVHDRPTEEWLKRLKDTFEAFGIPFVPTVAKQLQPKDVQKAVEALKEKDPDWFATKPLLAAMTKALYSEKCLGHFWLALSAYSHFTSPIRRYPDLQIHRMIKYELHKRLSRAERARFESLIPRVARITSTLERRAEHLEYDFRDLKICQYLLPRVGETFPWVVSTVMENGYFVEFMPSIEGFVSFSKYNKREAMNVGEKIAVRLESVDVRMRRIDLMRLQT